MKSKSNPKYKLKYSKKIKFLFDTNFFKYINNKTNKTINKSLY